MLKIFVGLGTNVTLTVKTSGLIDFLAIVGSRFKYLLPLPTFYYNKRLILQ